MYITPPPKSNTMFNVLKITPVELSEKIMSMQPRFSCIRNVVKVIVCDVTFNACWAQGARLCTDGLVQDYSNSIANAMELLQSCAKPAICF